MDLAHRAPEMKSNREVHSTTQPSICFTLYVTGANHLERLVSMVTPFPSGLVTEPALPVGHCGRSSTLSSRDFSPQLHRYDSRSKFLPNSNQKYHQLILVSCDWLSFLSDRVKAGSDCCKLPPTQENKQEIQETTANLLQRRQFYRH